MRQDLREGAHLFNTQHFWEAHEAWESVWLDAKARGDTHEANYVQALILCAAALHKRWVQGSVFGGGRNFEKALKKLEGVPKGYAERDGFDLQVFVEAVKAALQDKTLVVSLPLTNNES